MDAVGVRGVVLGVGLVGPVANGDWPLFLLIQTANFTNYAKLRKSTYIQLHKTANFANYANYYATQVSIQATTPTAYYSNYDKTT